MRISRLQQTLLGSPPRVRGKGGVKVAVKNNTGIIPARAGKSGRSVRWGWQTRDHPRACGEKLVNARPLRAVPGSPPRVRGKVAQLEVVQHGVGITPARAGKRPDRSLRSMQPRDHPRACGEKPMLQCCKALTAGSPPRVRGKALARTGLDAAAGITPARAGKSSRRARQPRSAGDHPRACGEKGKRCGSAR